MRFLADENFDGHILEGVLHRNLAFDVIRVQDTEIYQAADPVILEWAAREGRILLTHDVKTMVGFANERIDAGLPMPGVIDVNKQAMSLGQGIEELLSILGASEAPDWENLVAYLPMR
jgi:hypothetical protein